MKVSRILFASMISVGLAACGGGGNEPDPVSPAKPSTGDSNASNTKVKSGKAIDGYLAAANVCLDFNRNFQCDGADEYETITDQSGNYALDLPQSLSTNASLLVTAKAGVTIDLDNPDQPVTESFYLLANYDKPSVISPVTTMVEVKVGQGMSEQEAEADVIKNLGLSNTTQLYMDFVEQAADSSLSEQQKTDVNKIKMLNQVIAKVMAKGLKQSYQHVSADNSQAQVTQLFLNKFSSSALAIVNEQVDKAMAAGEDVEDISSEQISETIIAAAPDIVLSEKEVAEGEVTVITPSAPTSVTVDDINNSFGWVLVSGYSNLEQYEFSTDAGSSWQQVTANPIQLNDQVYPINSVQVRIKAEPTSNRVAGAVASNNRAYTVTPPQPSAPTNASVDDVNNTFGWSVSAGFSSASDYEYSTNSGSSWQQVSANPLQLADAAYAVGVVQVRVKADLNTGRQASAALVNLQAYTLTPAQPSAPTNPQVDDTANTFGWSNVAGFAQASDYEYSTNRGSSWSQVGANPISLPNQAFAVGAVQVRVKAGNNGRAAGAVLTNPTPYTLTIPKPAAPTAGVVNDANNTFAWTNATGFNQSSDYEYSLNSGQSWSGVSSNPISVGNRALAIGAVQVRVKAAPSSSRPAGDALANAQAFTVASTPAPPAPTPTPPAPPTPTPPAPTVPAAPTDAVMDDSKDTFDWTNVSGYSNLADYEYSTDAASSWQVVTAKPIQLENKDYGVNQVQLRVKADANSNRAAGLILKNSKAYTADNLPPAPTNGVVDDSYNKDTFTWTPAVGYLQRADYEISIDGGKQYTQLYGGAASTHSHTVGNRAVPVGQVIVRIKANSATNRLAGKELTNKVAFTQYDTTVSSPTYVVNDSYGQDYVEFTPTSKYPSVQAYQYSLDAGSSWQNATTARISIGNVDLASGQIQIRVKATDSNVAGSRATVTEAFTKVAAPSAPTILSENDADNKLVWQPITGINDVNLYEIKIETANWQVATSTTITLQDKAYAIGSIQIRLKENTSAGKPAGAIAANTTIYTKTPAQPSAPVVNVQDDNKNEFGWSNVNGFTKASDYELKINTNDWTSATTNPVVVGNIVANIGAVKVRVKKDPATGRVAGQEAANTVAFTKVASALLSKLADQQVNINAIRQGISDYNTRLGAISGKSGAELRAKAKELANAYQSLKGLLVVANNTKSVLQSALDTAADSESDQDKQTLRTAIAGLVSDISNLESLIGNAPTVLIKAFNDANRDGSTVTKADATMTNVRFAKLDWAGHYIEAATDQSNGWRCVQDLNARTKTVWALLQDGSTDGLDHQIFSVADGTGNTDLKSVYQTQGICGISNWQLPTKEQLQGFSEASISDSQFTKFDSSTNVLADFATTNAYWYDKTNNRLWMAKPANPAKYGIGDLTSELAKLATKVDRIGDVTWTLLPNAGWKAMFTDPKAAKFLDSLGIDTSSTFGTPVNSYWVLNDDAVSGKDYVSNKNGQWDTRSTSFGTHDHYMLANANLSDAQAITKLVLNDFTLLPYHQGQTEQFNQADNRYLYWTSSKTAGNDPIAISYATANQSYLELTVSSNSAKAQSRYVAIASPSAPTAAVQNDNNNTFDWTYVDNYSKPTDYEYSTDNGSSWSPVTAKPIQVGNVAVSSGHLQLRVTASAGGVAGVGSILSSSSDYTKVACANTFYNSGCYSLTIPLSKSDAEKYCPLISYNDSLITGDIANFATAMGLDTGTKYWLAGTSNALYYSSGWRVGYSSASSRVGICSHDINGSDAKPDAPTSPVQDDDKNTFDWTYSSGIELASRYEFSIDNGSSWTSATTKPISVGNHDLALGHVQVRVKELGVQPASDALASSASYTSIQCDGQFYDGVCYVVKTSAMTQAAASSSCVLASKDAISDLPSFATAFKLTANESSAFWFAEDGYYLGYSDFISGNWRVANSNSSDKGAICVGNGPGAPTSPVHDDDANTFGWSYVSGYTDPTGYEYSVDQGSSWSDVTSNPVNVGDVSLQAGDVQVRVKKAGVKDAGAILKSTKAYTSSTPLACSGGDLAKEIDGKCYLRIDSPASQSDAQAQCQSLSATLVSKAIDSQQLINVAVALNLNGASKYWLAEKDGFGYGYSIYRSFGKWKVDNAASHPSKLQSYTCVK